MRSNRKELAILRGKRTPETLAEWAAVFGEGDHERASRYALAVATFLGQPGGSEDGWSDYLGRLSPNTRKAYAYAVTEFFEWVAAKHKRVVPPHRVTRLDAEEYVNWLANRPFSLAEEKLKDGDRPQELALFEIIKDLGRAKIRDIIENLTPELSQQFFSRSSPGDLEDTEADRAVFGAGRRDLSHAVRRLITMDVVEGSPTLAELRRDHPQAGITQWKIGGKHFDDVFTYSVKKYKPVARTTVALRIAALSQFWKTLMQGENVAGGESILQYDIWEGVKKRVNRGISPEKKRASREQKISTETVLHMLEKAPRRTLVQLRNRAILYALVFMGLRTTELLLPRRAKPREGKMPYFDGSEPPALQVLRKGNKWMRIPYPPVALTPLIEFQTALEKRAAPVDAVQISDDRDLMASFYYRDLQLPDAPLFPSLAFWGANQAADYRKSMSRINLYRLLQKIAEESGLPDDLVKQVHPHAIRHFSANAMVSGGKDLREVQAILGHSSITTTEGYLEDVDDEVRLSGQAEILDFIKARGAQVDPVYAEDREERRRPKQPDVIDTYAIEAEFEETAKDEPITDTEVVVLSELSERLPSNEFPEAPDYDSPGIKVVDTARGDILVAGGEYKLIGISGEDQPTQEQLQNLADAMVEDKSPGSPDEVYEQLAVSGDYETVVFNRGGQKEKSWLLNNYPKMPKDFGLGRQSLLPWYVKAKGNISHAGFYKGLPPFPLWSYADQVDPYSARGQRFLDQIERLYMGFLEGDATSGTAPSPIRGSGLIRWFGFFAFHSRRFQLSFANTFAPDNPTFLPFENEIPLGEGIRMHKDAWLLEWLEKNSHTYRASVDSMKRGVTRVKGRGARSLDPEEQFLRSMFEGVDLLDQMPSWMVEDDPVFAMYRDNPKEFKDFIAWLKNLTGQALSLEREKVAGKAEEARQSGAERVRDSLLLFYESRDSLVSQKYEEKQKREFKETTEREEGGSRISGDAKSDLSVSRDAMRLALLGYLLVAVEEKYAPSPPSVDISRRYPQESMLRDRTADYVRKMSDIFSEFDIPNPNDPKYKGEQIESPRGSVYSGGSGPRSVKRRVDLMVRDLFGDQLSRSVNVFADSELFDPRWFRIDEKEHTIYVEKEAADELRSRYGLAQSPQLLLRRAARAMWEAREKGYDKLWGVMMSYFSWIVPAGSAMETEARAIVLPAEKMEIREERIGWLSDYVVKVRGIVGGKDVREAIEKEEKRPSKVRPKRRLVRLPGQDRPQEVTTHDLETLQEAQSNKPTEKLPRPSDSPREGQTQADWILEWDRYYEQEKAASADALDAAMLVSLSSADEWEEATGEFQEGSQEGESFLPNATMTRNGKSIYLHMSGEDPKGWYRVRTSSGMTPNTTSSVYVSPGMLYGAQKKISPARKILPSPFRMIAAMGLE